MVAGLTAVAALTAVLGSELGPASAALATLVLAQLLVLATRPPRDHLVRWALVALEASAVASLVITAGTHVAVLTAVLLLSLASSVSYLVALWPRVPWANFRGAAVIAGLLGGAIVAAMSFRGPAPVLIAGIAAGIAAAGLTVPATALGRLGTAGALALTVPPVIIALHPVLATLDRPLLLAFGLICLVAGHTAMTLEIAREVEPVAGERPESPPLISIWDHLRAPI